MNDDNQAKGRDDAALETSAPHQEGQGGISAPFGIEDVTWPLASSDAHGTDGAQARPAQERPAADGRMGDGRQDGVKPEEGQSAWSQSSDGASGQGTVSGVPSPESQLPEGHSVAGSDLGASPSESRPFEGTSANAPSTEDTSTGASPSESRYDSQSAAQEAGSRQQAPQQDIEYDQDPYGSQRPLDQPQNGSLLPRSSDQQCDWAVRASAQPYGVQQPGGQQPADQSFNYRQQPAAQAYGYQPAMQQQPVAQPYEYRQPMAQPYAYQPQPAPQQYGDVQQAPGQLAGQPQPAPQPAYQQPVQWIPACQPAYQQLVPGQQPGPWQQYPQPAYQQPAFQQQYPQQPVAPGYVPFSPGGRISGKQWRMIYQSRPDWPRLAHWVNVVRKRFSRVGLALAMVMVVWNLLAIAVSVVVDAFAPGAKLPQWATFLAGNGPLYLVAIPLSVLVFRTRPTVRRKPGKMSLRMFLAAMAITFPVSYVGNWIGNILSSMFSNGQAKSSINEMMEAMDPVTLLLTTVIIGPIFEEWLFRRLLIDHIQQYGEVTAIVVSATAFALFHGNLFQFFYVFGFGLIEGYVYVRTGKLRYTIAMHMTYNFCGGFLPEMALSAMGSEASKAISDGSSDAIEKLIVSGHGGELVPILLYAAFNMIMIVVGIVVAIVNRKKIVFYRTPGELPKGMRARTVLGNVGVNIFIVLCALEMILALFVR
ncbi:CPBP family glutamic-type intramembrane protease [Bifidobacterium sp. ESL0763]|uniref:CPBP family glutamic-type intramembrane protease n=1 Tax=Bifidobacterium sp. ESL0763 TaxID=2983227 RepID=UPI0023F9237F|nr:CPBP family glutamic-type intramembrane protease [Bifidobacterium sp. ESL0763]MDF7664372.1 CPBP family glutamic-type intramembrane protease [Bifidobacterium sp. ESL0763]